MLKGIISNQIFHMCLAALLLFSSTDLVIVRAQSWEFTPSSESCDSPELTGDLISGFCQSGSRGSRFGCRKRDSKDPGVLFRWRGQSAAEGVSALNEPLTSDRPDFTESSQVVGLGVFQIELGYTYSYDNTGTTRDIGHSYPETLFRYGIFADWFELRLGQNFANQRSNLEEASGAEDLYLGFKLGLTAQDGIRPEMALVPQMTVPTGAKEFSTNEVLSGCNWLYGWDINDRFSTAGSTQFNKAIDETIGDSYTEWAQSWTVGYGLTERIGGYSEWFALLPSGSATARTQHYLNSGITYNFSNDIQWDIRAGKGLSDASADYFVGSGLVLRFR